DGSHAPAARDFRPNAMTTAKHAAGTNIAMLIELASDTSPMSGGTIAPPTMAMTRKDAPDFVWAPGPRRLIAKMVGNWIDMKKLVAISAYSPSWPPAAA